MRTPPEDSTGLPHILEHSVLGGSQKYPMKEPFFEMVKGSLKTFLNAFTAPDRTTYPVASTNLKDFYNLVDVYLDAVFFPLLTPHHLDQEGWHYELESEDAPLKYKGVVFNEMKGVYSSPDGLLGRYGMHTLYPDTPYRHDSGGDPTQIPNLTYAQFKRFHETYYHPANAIFYFYGDDDPAKRLTLLAGVLDRFDAQPVQSEIPLQPLLLQPRRYTYLYGVDPGSDSSRRTLISLDWLLPENDDPARTMLLRVIGYALTGTQASPLRKALLDSGLGEDAFGGLGTGLRQMSFSAGMRNIASADADAVEALILSTLERVAVEGLEPDMLEAALNSIEFALRENNSGGYPRGLSLMQRAVSTWNYDGDPIAPMRFERSLTWVKEQLAADPALPGTLLRTLLIENPHRVTVVLEPDPTYNARLEADEQARLAQVRAAMSETDVQAVLANTAALRAMQAQADPPELVATLPSLDLDDLDRSNRTIPTALEQLNQDEVTLLHHDLHTNGVLYLTLGWDLARIPQPLLPYAELLGSLLTQMGTTREDYVKLSQRIGRKTGGIGTSSFLSAVRGHSEPAAWLMLGGKSTMERVPDLLAIMRDILLSVRLDNQERMRQIVRKSKAGMEASLVPSGSSYVDRRLRAAFS
ncbi:MAG: insulinase family protein, partial [Caldilineaceae bacterium]